MIGELMVGAHRVGSSQGLLWPFLRADILALGVALGTPLLGLTHQELEQFLLDTSRPRLREVLELQGSKRSGPREGGDEGEKQCPTCSKRFTTDSKLAVHRRHSHNHRTPLRDMVQEPKCPACKREFASMDGARTHLTQGKREESQSDAFKARVAQFIPPVEAERRFRGPNPVLTSAVLAFWGLEGAEGSIPHGSGGGCFSHSGDFAS